MDNDQTPIPGQPHSVPCEKLSNLITEMHGNGEDGFMKRTNRRLDAHSQKISKLEIAQAKIVVLGGLVSGVIVSAVSRLL